MDKLRGTGTTFSTSGKRWLPFRHNPKIAKRHAKFKRAQAGMTKAEIETENRRAIAEHDRAVRCAEPTGRATAQPCKTS